MKTAVTLQVFVTEEEFSALMEKGYTAKQPATTGMLLEDETTEALGRSIETWLHARNEEYKEELLTTDPAITPVPLDVCECCDKVSISFFVCSWLLDAIQG